MSKICYADNMDSNTETSGLPAELARILTKRQDELGMSLRQISDASGVSHMTVKRILAGDNAVSVDTFMAVARALRLTAWKVYKEAEENLSE